MFNLKKNIVEPVHEREYYSKKSCNKNNNNIYKVPIVSIIIIV